MNSEVVKRFMAIVMGERVDTLIQQFKSRDYDGDGNLNVEGFSATLMGF